MTVALLICHSLIAVVLMGAITHQVVALGLESQRGEKSFFSRYSAVRAPSFSNAIVVLYVISFVLGSIIYPSYRLDVRPPLEEMRLGWAVGLFEMKEHFGGIGLAALPLYSHYWKDSDGRHPAPGAGGVTLLLTFIIWFDFLSGHVLNNIRGL